MLCVSNTIEGFGERISNLVGCVATTEDDVLVLNALTYKVILHFNVLCTLIDSRIVCKVFCSIIVNSDLDRLFGVCRIKYGAKS